MTTDNRESNFFIKNENRWNKYFKLLVQYKEEYGDFNELGKKRCALQKWAFEQSSDLQRYKNGHPTQFLQKEHVQKLTDIGFTIQRRHLKWEDYYEQLVDFKRKHGHIHLDKRVESQKELYSWCQSQHKKYHSTQSGSQLRPQRIRLLEEIGFDFNQSRPLCFGERVEELEKYKKIHGHCNVQQNENLSLARFCAKQRNQYRLYLNGEDSEMCAEVNKLVPWTELYFSCTYQS